MDTHRNPTRLGLLPMCNAEEKVCADRVMCTWNLMLAILLTPGLFCEPLASKTKNIGPKVFAQSGFL
eukprot:435729-Amphidinium_carterae.1